MTSDDIQFTTIRPAASTVLWRNGPTGPEVLMGQRGAQAAFMPSKYVFPGGAIDAADADMPRDVFLHPRCIQRLRLNCPDGAPGPDAIVTAALRELAEETGLHLSPGSSAGGGLRFIFRAITPHGRSRRFDARFLLADATNIIGNPNDFSAASDELSHLHWVALTQARRLDLPFITEVVLAEIGHLLRKNQDGDGVPFFDNSGPVPIFRRLI